MKQICSCAQEVPEAIRAIGGGLTVGFSFPAALAQKGTGRGDQCLGRDPPGRRIIIRYARSEDGRAA